jgi:hypothetical protein
MNNFTKQELEHILSCVCMQPLDDLILLNKIQSIIDNYCEHEDICKGNHMYVIDKCASCGKKINDNQ